MRACSCEAALSIDRYRAACDTVEKSPLSAISLAFFAAFHAARIALASHGKGSFRKHEQVKQAVHRDLVLPNIWDEELGQNFNALFGARHVSDYGSLADLKIDAKKALALVHPILEAVHLSDPKRFPLPEG